MADTHPTKQCGVCEATKPTTEFHLCRGRPAYLCKECHRAKGRANYQKKREHYIRANIAYRKANWEAHQRRSATRYQAIKGPKLLEQRRSYRAKNLPAIRDYYKRRRAECPDQYRSYYHARRAREKGAAGRFRKEDIRRLYESQGGKCHYCRRNLERGYHIDHIVALINGGSNWPDNLQLLCPSCNTRKNRRDELVFAQEMGRLF